jgi:hypothetical protein
MLPNSTELLEPAQANPPPINTVMITPISDFNSSLFMAAPFLLFLSKFLNLLC